MLNGSTYMVRPCMAAFEYFLQLAAHGVGIFPVVGGTGIVLRQGTDEGAVFHPGHIAGVGAGQETARPQVFVQLDQRTAGHHFDGRVCHIPLASHPPSEWPWAGLVRQFFQPIGRDVVACKGPARSCSFHSHPEPELKAPTSEFVMCTFHSAREVAGMLGRDRSGNAGERR